MRKERNKSTSYNDDDDDTEDILTSHMLNTQLVPQSTLKHQAERAREDAYSKLD
jgi:hypothetical protein